MCSGFEPDASQQLAHAPLDVVLAAQPQRQPDDLPDALARVQRRLRVLEDHLQLAPHGPQLAPARRA